MDLLDKMLVKFNINFWKQYYIFLGATEFWEINKIVYS